jgi:hypothetical protein
MTLLTTISVPTPSVTPDDRSQGDVRVEIPPGEQEFVHGPSVARQRGY